MVTMTGDYDGELRCNATHTKSGTTLVTDAPTDNHGKGGSFSPTDLVAVALATCVVTTIAIWAEKHGVAFGGATYAVTKEMTSTSPRRIARLGLTLHIKGDYSADQRARIESVAHACPVHQSLHPSVVVDLRCEWLQDEAGLGGEGLEPATSPV